ncbi:hypothetical protein SAMN05443575_2348 [Jatrophihabitans endophyticus]|uniref:Uncharacterized protein n=1 Tax=Jatrophihabitans endophyticus TaxID=1206085 RepID=A0A1M5L4A8_9ACTN|nr:hypothetical protein [Jatrophihabitans endophyticus]SHG59857.1 hypothetical protein SAMN05443575_2348 [Jatrophihabitans endophyticus]
MQRGTRTLTGLGLVLGGALLGMLSMTVLPWYRSSLGGILAHGTTVADVRDSIAGYRRFPDFASAIDLGLSPAYFGWLAIAVLLVAALVGLVAAGLGGGGRAAAVGATAAALALAGVVLTAVAVEYVRVDAAKLAHVLGSRVRSTPPAYGDFVAHSGVGAWGMVLAYLLVGAGALLAAGGREQLRELLAETDHLPEDADTAEKAGALGTADTPDALDSHDTHDTHDTADADDTVADRQRW